MTATIERMHVRWRGADEVRRAALLEALLDWGLDDAFDDLGLGRHDVVCVRRVAVPSVVAAASEPDAAVVGRWAAGVATAVARATATAGDPKAGAAARVPVAGTSCSSAAAAGSGVSAASGVAAGDDVVVFRSWHHALGDLAVGVARGWLGRAWAWRAVGVWPSSVGGTIPDAPGAAPLVAAESAGPRWPVAASATRPDPSGSVVRAGGPAHEGAPDASVGAPAPGATPGTAARPSRPTLGAWSSLELDRAAEALAVALSLHPEAASGVLRHVARLGLLAQLEARLGPQRWDAVTAAAPAGIGRAATATRPVEVVPEARTPWGGLLLLLHLVDATRALDVQAAMYALGRDLITPLLHEREVLDRRDPGLLAFAGLSPDDDPPSADDDAGELGLDELDGSLDLEDVLRRPATIIADPGWIEARFSIDDVSVDIRRAGLDLDPGWLPWLGVVVRFTYG